MRSPTSALQLSIFAIVIVLMVSLHNYTLPYLRLGAAKVGGFEETVLDSSTPPLSQGDSNLEKSFKADHFGQYGQSTRFQPGVPKVPGSDYSRVIVIPRTKDEDIAWIAEELPGLELSVYVVDEPNAPLHPPKNKGHEVMAPGCPKWLFFNSTEELIGKQEESYLAKSWSELFPLEPFPPYLAQPCCAQFAVSSERINSIPRSRFAFYRDWMIKTPLTDYVSGRIMEYSWQYIFTGKGAMCPAEHLCYCDTFGICFGGSTQYEHFVQLEDRRKEFESDLEKWKEADRLFRDSLVNGTSDEIANSTAPDQTQQEHLQEQIRIIDKEREVLKKRAMTRGDDPRLRAEECGRTWMEGDGF
ncbi:MAG: hypothetical protein Q9195_004451 [Heterodermia aff. obscurata]